MCRSLLEKLPKRFIKLAQEIRDGVCFMDDRDCAISLVEIENSQPNRIRALSKSGMNAGRAMAIVTQTTPPANEAAIS